MGSGFLFFPTLASCLIVLVIFAVAVALFSLVFRPRRRGMMGYRRPPQFFGWFAPRGEWREPPYRHEHLEHRHMYQPERHHHPHHDSGFGSHHVHHDSGFGGHHGGGGFGGGGHSGHH